MPATCDLELILNSARMPYRVKKNDQIDGTVPKYEEGLRQLKNKGYQIAHSISPKTIGGSGDSTLAAVCMVPIDPTDQGPIIIAYKGTKYWRDIRSDAVIIKKGVAEDQLREAAFKYFKDARAQYPGREIIITGHSLGGNLAQDVAMRAYNSGQEDQEKRLVYVRTFNSAPIRTNDKALLEKRPELEHNFRNYSLEADKVSKFNEIAAIGDVIYIKMKTGWKKSHHRIFGHGMPIMTKYFPRDLMEQQVGTTADAIAEVHALRERIHALMHAYECRIDGEFFSSLRDGQKDLAILRPKKQALLKEIDDSNYEQALQILKSIKSSLKSKGAAKMLDKLMANIEYVKSLAAVSSKQQKTSTNEVQHERAPGSVTASGEVSKAELTGRRMETVKAHLSEKYLGKIHIKENPSGFSYQLSDDTGESHLSGRIERNGSGCVNIIHQEEVRVDNEKFANEFVHHLVHDLGWKNIQLATTGPNALSEEKRQAVIEAFNKLDNIQALNITIGETALADYVLASNKP